MTKRFHERMKDQKSGRAPFPVLTALLFGRRALHGHFLREGAVHGGFPRLVPVRRSWVAAWCRRPSTSTSTGGTLRHSETSGSVRAPS